MSDIITEDMIMNSFLMNKFINDYGTIKTMYDDGTCDVTFQVLLTFAGQLVSDPLVVKGVELLYPSSSSLIIDLQPKAGDPVLLLGLRRYIPKTNAKVEPFAPKGNEFYALGTLKAIPLSALNTSPGVTIRAKDGKLRVKNDSVSLYKVLTDLEKAIETFSNTTSQASITASGTSATSLASAIVSLLATMNTSMINVLNEIKQLLED